MRTEPFLYFLLTIIFLGDSIILPFTNVKLSVFGLVILIFYGLFIPSKFKLNRNLYFFLIYLFIVSVSSIFMFPSSLLNTLFKSFILIFGLPIIYNIVVKFQHTFKQSYVLAAKITIIFMVIQIIAFLLNYIGLRNIIWDSSIILNASNMTFINGFPRLSSLYTEPSYLASFLIPYLGIAEKKQRIYTTILIGLTFSLIGYLGALIFYGTRLTLIKSNRFNSSILIVCGITLLTLIMGARLDISDFSSLDLTTLIYVYHSIYIYQNWTLFLTGLGIDNYEEIWNLYSLSSLINKDLINTVKLLDDDFLMLKSSPFLPYRVFVELGVIGVFTFAFYIYKRRFNFFTFGVIALATRSGEYNKPLFLLFLVGSIISSHNFNIIHSKK